MAVFMPCSKSTNVSAGHKRFCSSSRVIISPGRSISAAKIWNGRSWSLIRTPALRIWPAAKSTS